MEDQGSQAGLTYPVTSENWPLPWPRCAPSQSQKPRGAHGLSYPPRRQMVYRDVVEYFLLLKYSNSIPDYVDQALLGSKSPSATPCPDKEPSKWWEQVWKFSSQHSSSRTQARGHLHFGNMQQQQKGENDSPFTRRNHYSFSNFNSRHICWGPVVLALLRLGFWTQSYL